jgi:hypothetical protein
MWIAIAHPILLFAVLLNFNVIGDLTRNIICLSILAVDCLAAFVGGIWVQGRIKGEY